MPVQYKDFDKDVKDLLNKQYGSAWKIESKFKGPKDSVWINPMADSKGVTVDVEYDCSKTGLKLKASVNPELTVKPKVTYEVGGNKVEVSTQSDVRNLDYEVNYELKEKGFAASANLTKKAVKASAVVSVAHHCVVGADVTHDLSGKNALGYTLGSRYNAKGTILNASTSAFKSFSVGVYKGLNIANKNVTTGAIVTYPNPKIQVGAEMPCLICPDQQVKFRINSDLQYAVAVIRKFGDNWKAALSWESTSKCCQFGLQLTRESK